MYLVLFHIYLIYNMLWRILNHLQGDKYKGIYTLLHIQWDDDPKFEYTLIYLPEDGSVRAETRRRYGKFKITCT